MFRFEWDSGNLEKLDKVRASGRDFTQDELESAFYDPNQIIGETYSDEISGEPRYICIGMSNLNRVINVVFVKRTDADGEPKLRIFNASKTKGNKLKTYNENRNS